MLYCIAGKNNNWKQLVLGLDVFDVIADVDDTFLVRKNKAYPTMYEKYHGITQIEQVEGGGLCISYVYIDYKTNSI